MASSYASLPSGLSSFVSQYISFVLKLVSATCSWKSPNLDNNHVLLGALFSTVIHTFLLNWIYNEIDHPIICMDHTHTQIHQEQQVDFNSHANSGQLLVAPWPLSLCCEGFYISIKSQQVRIPWVLTASHKIWACGDTDASLLSQRQIHISLRSRGEGDGQVSFNIAPHSLIQQLLGFTMSQALY